MFKLYLDESHGPENVYTVGGYIATVGQWEEFSREWCELLAAEGITELHKANFENLWGEYKKWQSLPKNAQDAIKKRINIKACDIILRRVNAGFAVSIRKSDYENYPKLRWAHHLGESVYALGVLGCMHLVVSWIQKFRRTENIDYIFESGAVGAGEVGAILKRLSRREELKQHFNLTNWEFVSKRADEKVPNKTYIPLQAADFLAYEAYKHTVNRVVDGIRLNKLGVEFKPRLVLKHLIQKDNPKFSHFAAREMPTPHYVSYLDEETFRQLDDQLSQLPSL